MTPAIHIHNEQIAEFCARHRISRLALFGSVLRSDFRADSDVDVVWETISHDLPQLLAEIDRVLGPEEQT